MSASAARALVPRPEARPETRPAARPAARTAVRRSARPAPNQSALFEAEPYRVARPRTAAPRSPARVPPARTTSAAAATPPAPRASVSAMAAPEYSRSLVPFVAMCVAIVVGSLVAVLLLNTSMTKRAYDTRDLRTELAQLENQRSELRATIEEDASPQALAAAAQALGMSPAPRVGFVEIETGDVLAPGATG